MRKFHTRIFIFMKLLTESDLYNHLKISSVVTSGGRLAGI